MFMMPTAQLRGLFAVTSSISDYDGKKDNNFTLLRLIFAFAVLFGHGFAITDDGTDPISLLLGVWIGEVAVSGFFLISGFLIAGSFQRQGLLRFTLLRLMRIYPAVVVCIALTIIAGSIVSSISPEEYWASAMTWQYAQNVFLQYLTWTLPGVFTENPLQSVNGSLWTLPLEVRCYFLLLCAGFFGVLDRRARVNVAAAMVLSIMYFSYSYIPLMYHEAFAKPLSYFIVGVLIWANRDIIKFSRGLALLAVFLCVFGNIHENELLFCIGFSYVVFYMAFAIPHVDIDKFGDISYGIYIYAWPVQQFAWSDNQGAYANFMIAAPITITIAAASWFIIEKPCLNLLRKKRASPFAGRLQLSR